MHRHDITNRCPDGDKLATAATGRPRFSGSGERAVALDPGLNDVQGEYCCPRQRGASSPYHKRVGVGASKTESAVPSVLG